MMNVIRVWSLISISTLLWSLMCENYTAHWQNLRHRVPRGMRAMPLSGKMRGRHLSHRATAKTVVTQPHVQMGPCRARPVTPLRTVGEIEISAQRLDLEGKHSGLLCHSGKSRTLVSYKWLTYLQNECWPPSVPTVCVIYEEHTMVKYPGKAYSDFGQVCVIIILMSPHDSQVPHRHVWPC